MLSAAPTAAEASELSAAVVVCTARRERLPLLRACVAALLAGERRPDELIVVVDSNPVLYAELARTLPAPARLLTTERQGLSGARNVGIAATHADVVAFIDDDASADRRWLATILEAFAADGRTLAVGGPVLPRWGGERRWMCDQLLWVVGCTYDGHREDAGAIRNPIGANMAFRRRELVELGGFATGFGKRGEALATCDETELGLRVARVHGPERIRYLPVARVEHFVPPARVSWRHLARRSFAEGLAKGRLARIYERPALGVERRYARTLLRSTVPRMLLASVRGADSRALGGAFAILTSLALAAAGVAAERVAGRSR